MDPSPPSHQESRITTSNVLKALKLFCIPVQISKIYNLKLTQILSHSFSHTQTFKRRAYLKVYLKKRQILRTTTVNLLQKWQVWQNVQLN